MLLPPPPPPLLHFPLPLILIHFPCRFSPRLFSTAAGVRFSRHTQFVALLTNWAVLRMDAHLANSTTSPEVSEQRWEERGPTKSSSRRNANLIMSPFLWEASTCALKNADFPRLLGFRMWLGVRILDVNSCSPLGSRRRRSGAKFGQVNPDGSELLWPKTCREIKRGCVTTRLPFLFSLSSSPPCPPLSALLC